MVKEEVMQDKYSQSAS
jgi:hypothetical protein